MLIPIAYCGHNPTDEFCVVEGEAGDSGTGSQVRADVQVLQHLGNLLTWQLGNWATWQFGNLVTLQFGNCKMLCVRCNV